jgi:hypothetical protein
MATIFPADPEINDEYQGYRYNGTSWDIIGQEYNPTVYSGTQPSGAKAGDIWIDSSTDVPSISPETILTINAASATYATKAELENVSSTSIPFLKMLSGWYYKSPSQDTNTNQVTNKTHWQPILISETTTFDRIAIRTASTTWTAPNTATIRLGIFNDNNGFPSTVALDAGTVNPSANNTTYEITINQTLSPGIYWLAFNIISSSNTGSYLGNTLTSFNNMPVGKILSGTIRSIVAFTYTQNTTNGFTSAPAFSNSSVEDTLNTISVFLRVA